MTAGHGDQLPLFPEPGHGDQLPLFDAHHDGPTYDAARDKARLNGQQGRVFRFMSDGRWRTLAEISKATGYGEASVSARLRDLRKAKFGGYRMDSEHRGGGLWRYRVWVA